MFMVITYGNLSKSLRELMLILAYILEFGMAWIRLTCPFSLDWELAALAHAQLDVNADRRPL